MGSLGELVRHNSVCVVSKGEQKRAGWKIKMNQIYGLKQRMVREGVWRREIIYMSETVNKHSLHAKHT